MNKRMYWLGGLLAAVLLMTCLAVGFNSEPRDESGHRIDTSAEAVLHPAFEMYGWFVSEPLKHEDATYSDVLPYCRVTDERFANLKELSAAVKDVFSEEIAVRLLESGLYIDIDGRLYVNAFLGADEIEEVTLKNDTEAAEAAENVISKEIFSVVSEEAEKVVYHSEVTYGSGSRGSGAENVLDYEFVYEKVNGKWVFTEFEYYR